MDRDSLLELTAMSFEPTPEQRTDHFTAADRKALIELSIDMQYMKRAMEELRQQDTSGTNATKADIKELWIAVNDLKNYRWWMAGFAAAASLIGGFIVSWFRGH